MTIGLVFSPLPPGWAETPLLDLVTHRSGNGKLIKGKLHKNPGPGLFPAYSASGQDVWRDEAEHEGEAIIVSAVGARCGKAFRADGKWSAIANTHVVWPNADAIQPSFLWYLINNEQYWVKSGTAQPFVKVRLSFERSIGLPPLHEQHRIVEAIESYFTRLDDAVANLERVQRNLKRYRASVLKSAVEGRLVPTEAELARTEGRDYEPASVLLERILTERRRRWEEAELAKMKAKGKPPKNDKWKAKYKEPVEPDTSELPDLPEGWCWTTLPQLGELNRGKSKHRPRNDPRLLDGAYPFIQTGNVRHSDGFITEHTATYSDFGLAQSRLWPAGTLCITIAANIADTGILKFDACFPDSIIGFLNENEPTLVRFIELFIRTAKGDLDRYAPATAQKNINLAILSAVAVPLPPLSEQARIVSELDKVLSLAAATESTAKMNCSRATRLQQATLKWAFEGKLVDQNPTDEPARELLGRIEIQKRAPATKHDKESTKRRGTRQAKA